MPSQISTGYGLISTDVRFAVSDWGLFEIKSAAPVTSAASQRSARVIFALLVVQIFFDATAPRSISQPKTKS